MSIDTVGFMCCGNKEVFKIRNLINQCIVDYCWPKFTSNNGFENFRYRNIKVEFSFIGETIIFNFRDGDDHRNLFIHFDCNGDYKDVYKGPKIILSLGCWGNSSELIRRCCVALQEYLGCDFFFTENDCMDVWKHCSIADYGEDFGLENGNYENRCTDCQEMFRGYKRRIICKVCSKKSYI